MGFFDKMKTFVGVGAPTIKFKQVEDRLPVTDTGIKYQITVESEKEVTAIAITETIKALYKDDDGTERSTILATDTDKGEHWIESDNPFPGKISKNNNWEYSGSIYMDDEKSKLMQNLFAKKNSSNLRVVLVVEVDIKETGMLFDPSVETTITLF